MPEPKCEICGISVFKANLHRNAPKGQIPAHWRCIQHLDPEYIPDGESLKAVQRIKEKKFKKSDYIIE